MYVAFFVWLISFSMSSKFIHVVVCVFHSFYGWVILYYMNISHFIYLFIYWWIFGITTVLQSSSWATEGSTINRYLGCFCLLVIINRSDVNVHVQGLFEYPFSLYLDIYLGMDLKLHMVIVYLNLWGIFSLIFRVRTLFYILTYMYKGSNFTTFLSTCIYVCFSVIGIYFLATLMD
jgi:hypothetical protein